MFLLGQVDAKEDILRRQGLPVRTLVCFLGEIRTSSKEFQERPFVTLSRRDSK